MGKVTPHGEAAADEGQAVGAEEKMRGIRGSLLEREGCLCAEAPRDELRLTRKDRVLGEHGNARRPGRLAA